MPEYVTMHEANHVMQEKVCVPLGIHHYIPWMDEGLADVLGKMMLFRATGDEKLITKVKNFRTEIDVGDPRKVTYHYGEETALLVVLRGRLPFVKALMHARQKDPMSINWNMFAGLIKQGFDPHVAVVKAFNGTNVDAFKKRFESDEKKFRSEADLDQTDLRVIATCLATTPPATISAGQYKAALWISREIENNYPNHFVESSVLPPALLQKIGEENNHSAVKCSHISADMWKKHPVMGLKILVAEESVPSELKDSIEKLSDAYFILKRKIGDKIFFEPYGGGLPYRLGTGEIRCKY